MIHRQVHFTGLGFEKGQGKAGLASSAARARIHLPPMNRLGLTLVDHGDILDRRHGGEHRYRREGELDRFDWEAYIHAFSRLRSLSRDNRFLLNWGGDHSAAIATVGAFVDRHPEGYVLWIDAHADMNLPEFSPTGYLHGMPLALLMDLNGAGRRVLPWMDRFLDPKKLIYFGVRDLDPFEQETIASRGLRAYSMADIRRRGLRAIVAEISALIGGFPLHVSFDIDSMDPAFAPSTGVPVGAGLTPEDVVALSPLFASSSIASVDVVEVNPALGTAAEVERTYQMSFVFLKSVFSTHHGGVHDRLGERDQRHDEASLEPRSPFSAEGAPFDRVRSLRP